MLPKINPTQTEAWKALNTHFAQNDFELRSLFQYNPERFNQFSVQREEYLFDYSKNLIDAKTFELLQNLAEESKLKSAIDAMFSGEKINETEGRAVLHTALRDFSDQEILVDGENIKPGIKRVLNQMKTFLIITLIATFLILLYKKIVKPFLMELVEDWKQGY